MLVVWGGGHTKCMCMGLVGPSNTCLCLCLCLCLVRTSRRVSLAFRKEQPIMTLVLLRPLVTGLPPVARRDDPKGGARRRGVCCKGVRQ